jgi:hypothetical protein
MFNQGIFSLVTMGVAILTFFAGIAAVRNARRINQEKHQQGHGRKAH